MDTGFDEFVRASSPRMLALARLLTGDPARAEDLCQDAYARLLLKWDRLDLTDPVAYVRRSIVNAQTDWWRRALRRERPTAEPPETAYDDGAAARADRAALDAALAELTAKERAVVVLRFYEDLSEAQIAAQLGVRPGTVKSTCARALGKLRTSRHLALEDAR